MGVLKRWNGTKWEIVGRNPPQANLIDLSNATSDYLLDVSETAFLNFSNVASVPLHVQVQEGLYELKVIGAYNTVWSGNDSDCTLLPNNTTVTNITRRYHHQYSESAHLFSGGHIPGLDKFILGGMAVSIDTTIRTYTNSKHCLSHSSVIRDSGNKSATVTEDCLWVNSTTPWTSLGTLTFPFPHSGKIIIKRII